MLHHFYDNMHPKGQGAISAEEFEELLDYLQSEFKLIGAEEWLSKSRNSLLNQEICLTFDDGLLCQFEIALPILEKRGLTAFWFVYSSVLEGNIESLEKYRHFRTTKFKSVNEFYETFFRKVSIIPDINKAVDVALSTFDVKEYLKPFPFYSDSDKIFRYLRDQVLKTEQYDRVMNELINDFQYRISSEELWLNKSQVSELSSKGHIIGLHSHTHPTRLASMSEEDQWVEYKKNKETLEEITNKKVFSMSHPCNSYSLITLNVLKKLGIEVGFCSNMENIERVGLEYPREDHMNIMAEI